MLWTPGLLVEGGAGQEGSWSFSSLWGARWTSGGCSAGVTVGQREAGLGAVVLREGVDRGWHAGKKGTGELSQGPQEPSTGAAGI